MAKYFGAGVPAQVNFTVYFYTTASSRTAVCSGNNGISNSWSCSGRIPSAKTAGATGLHKVSMIMAGVKGSAGVVNGTFYLCPSSTACATNTALTAKPNPGTISQVVTYTAELANPIPNGGTVSFTDNGTSLPGCGKVSVNTSTGSATCKVTYKATGSHSVKAKYSGNADFKASTSKVLTEVISH